MAGTKLNWYVYAYDFSDTKGTAPRIALASDGKASGDTIYATAGGYLGTIPNEMFAQPDSTKARTCPTVRAAVPADGIYTVRGHARDLSSGASSSNGDGVRLDIVSEGNLAASQFVSYDATTYSGSAVEAAFSADRLWLRTDTKLDFAVDPVSGNPTDATGFGVCYVKEEDAADAPSVINIDITGSDGVGRFSAYEGAGREGFADWTAWNAMRYSGSIAESKTSEYTIKNCREADGVTRRNVAFTLKRESGDNIAKGWSPTGNTAPLNLAIWAKSTGPSDIYTFTLSGLKANESYTLYLYGSKGTDDKGNIVDGNASFTIGGVTKTPDEPWNMRDAKVCARFDVTSDANGEITGTFAAGDADTSGMTSSLQGGAFNGLTLVGELPDFVPSQLLIIIR